jgi:hypothetical protein
MDSEVKTKVLKVVTIDAQFPELKGGAVNQMGRGEGGSVKAAMANAVRDLLKQPKLRKKRFTTFTAIVSIGQKLVDKEPQP